MPKSATTFRAFGPFSRCRGLGSAALCVAVFTAAPLALAMTIKGKVKGYEHLTNPVWEEAKDAERHLYSFREPVPTVRDEFRKLFPHIPKELCVAALAAEKQPPQQPILIRVGGGRTTPVTIVVTPATQLQFQNTDPFTHRLYAAKVKTFSASDTVKGGVRTWTAPDAAGTYEIRDEAAPSLRMWIVVEPKVAALAYPSLDGQWALNVSEPGDYELQAYFAGEKVGKSLSIPMVAGRDVDLSRAPFVVATKKSGDPKKK